MNAKEATAKATKIREAAEDKRRKEAWAEQEREIKKAEKDSKPLIKKMEKLIEEAVERGSLGVDMRVYDSGPASFAARYFQDKGYNAGVDESSHEMGDNEYPCTVRETHFWVNWDPEYWLRKGYY